MSATVTVVLSGQEALVARFRNANDRLLSILQGDLIDVAMDVRDDAAQRAGKRTGRLASGIQATVTRTTNAVAVVVFTSGVPYAAAQEYGAVIPGHMIAARNKVLAFMWPGAIAYKGGMAFFKHVMWPGAKIEPKHYILNALKNHRDQFEQACRDAMMQTVEEATR